MLPFFNILSNAILQSLWQFALLLSIYYLCSLITNNKRIVYLIAISLQLSGFALFIKTIFFESTISNFQFSATFQYQFTTIINPLISIVYILVLAFLTVKFCFKLVYLKKIHTTNTIHNDLEKWYIFVSKHLPNKNIIIKVTSNITSPVTYGFLKPIIVLPFALCNTLSTKEMELVLLHEIAHIIRKDYLVHIGLQIVNTVMFFNPFAQILAKAIEQEREYCCDDWVLKQIPENLQYAQTLFAVAKNQKKLQQLAFAQAFAKPAYLLKRIERITKQSSNSKKLALKQLLGLSFVLITSLILIVFFNNRNEKKKTGVLNNVTVISNKNYVAVDKIIVKPVAIKEIKVNKINKSFKVSKPIVVVEKYNKQDRQNLKEGFQFLSNLAKEHAAIQKLIENNPGIETLTTNNQETEETKIWNTAQKQATENSRYFYVPKTNNKKAKFITITVIDTENNKQKVVIEIEEVESSTKS